VHEATLRRVLDQGPPAPTRVTKRAMTLLSGVGDELRAEEDQAIETATLAGAGGSGSGEMWRGQIEAELAAVAEMRRIAEAARGRPDARIERLFDWISREMVPGLGTGGVAWTGRRLLLFTEYEDTRRWVEQVAAEIAIWPRPSRGSGRPRRGETRSAAARYRRPPDAMAARRQA
jgi:hypothetical protein